MRFLFVLTALFAATAATSVPPALAQAPAEVKSERPNANHFGPRHNRAAHEAALRAKAEGRRMAEPRVHAGGRHNEQAHMAALRAQREADEAAKR